jgi:hypothetical protein
MVTESEEETRLTRSPEDKDKKKVYHCLQRTRFIEENRKTDPRQILLNTMLQNTPQASIGPLHRHLEWCSHNWHKILDEIPILSL